MRTERKQKTVQYKRATLMGSRTLQDMLTQALAADGSWAKAAQRHESINPDTKDSRLINHHRTHQGMLFGQLIFIEAGKSQAILRIDTESTEYSIKTLTPDDVDMGKEPDGAAKSQREFVDSMLYFGVIDNHVAIVQSRALKSQELENHLGWFLGSACAGLLPDGSALILNDTASADTIEKLKNRPAKSIQIGSPIRSELITQPGVDGVSAPAPEKVRFKLAHEMLGALRTLLGSNSLDGLELEDALDEANLKVHVVVTYDRKTSECGQLVLDTIAASMRHMPEDDFSIVLKDGGVIKGDQLRLSGKLTVGVINGVVDETGLCTEMHKWLVSQTGLPHVE